MSKHDLGLKPGLPLPAPVGPASHPGLPGPAGTPGDPGFNIKGIDGPQPPPAAPVPEVKPKAFIILIRHIQKGTLHTVSKKDGALAEFEEMEHAMNAAQGIPGCQQHPYFIQAIYE